MDDADEVRTTAAVSSARGQVRSTADPGAMVAMGSGLVVAAGHDVLALRRETGHGSAGARHGGPV
jgi:hypothetical protein